MMKKQQHRSATFDSLFNQGYKTYRLMEGSIAVETGTAPAVLIKRSRPPELGRPL
jgi:hypothetical protein